jgi:DNA-binding SARP family transcriptional activator
LYLDMLDKLITDAEARASWEEGLLYGRTAMSHDPADERTHFRMMRLFSMTGKRTAALRQFELCATALRDELGVEPEAQTRKLYEVIRDEGGVVAPPRQEATTADLPARRPRPTGAIDPLRLSLARLQDLRLCIDQVQQELMREIQALTGKILALEESLDRAAHG